MDHIETEEAPLSLEEYQRQQVELASIQRQQWLRGDDLPIQGGLVICQSWALQRIKTQHAAALKQLSGDATTEERDTWPVQLAAAQAVQNDSATPVQQAMLDALLLGGENREQLVARIIQKDQAVQALIGLAGGLKRKTEQAVAAAETVEVIAAIMEQAGTQMSQAIEQFKQQIGATS